MAISQIGGPTADTGSGSIERVYGIQGISNLANDTYSAGHYAFYLYPTNGVAFTDPVVSFKDGLGNTLATITLKDGDLDATATSPWVGYVYLFTDATQLVVTHGTSVAGSLKITYSSAPVMQSVVKYTTTTANVVFGKQFRALIFGGGGSGGTGWGYYGWGGGGGGSGYLLDQSNIPAGTYTITIGAANANSSVGAYVANKGNGGGSGQFDYNCVGGAGGSGGAAARGGSSAWYVGGSNGTAGEGNTTANVGGAGSGIALTEIWAHGPSVPAVNNVGESGGFYAGGNGGNFSGAGTKAAAAANSAGGGGGGSNNGSGYTSAGAAGGSGVVYVII